MSWAKSGVTETYHDDKKVLTATFDLEALQTMRHGWGLFRDRRPDLYQPLLTLDGNSTALGRR